MDLQNLIDMSCDWGVDSYGKPFFDMIVNNEHYNLLDFLNDSNCMGIIAWGKALSGLTAIMVTLVSCIRQIPHILHGAAHIGGANKFDISDVRPVDYGEADTDWVEFNT